MKFLWCFILGLSSCKTTRVNDSGPVDGPRQEHELELLFVNVEANYRVVINAINEIGSVSGVRYQVGSANHPLNVVSVTCSAVTAYTFLQFKKKLGACGGVVSIYEPSMK